LLLIRGLLAMPKAKSEVMGAAIDNRSPQVDIAARIPALHGGFQRMN
jgi:hypothetical protein